MDRVLDFLNRHKATALALIAFFVGAVAFFNNGFELVKNHLIQKHAEDSLEKLNAGVSVKHVEAIFGAPIVERKTSKKGLSTYLYSFKKFYLQVVFDKENTVKFFAVTIKDASFNPKVPYLNQRLGKFRFSDMNSGKTLYSNKSSKFYEYAEFHYFGFPGNYRNIYIAYNPSGTDYGAQMESPSIPELELPSAIAKFKSSAVPNTYGVGEILGDEEQWVPKTGVGIDFYTAIDLPEHNY